MQNHGKASDDVFAPKLAWLDLFVAIALLIAIASVYAQCLGFAFVGWDDPQYVIGNAVVQGGLQIEGAAWAFTTTYMGSWHPLTWLSHMLDVELFGLDPAGHHATSVVLHMLNSALLFGLLRTATGSRWRSALVAALFGLHPIHVESVAWIAERKDVLSTFTGLLSLGAYAAYVRRPSLLRYLMIAALFCLSLMSKPMLVTLPIVLLLVDYWPLRRPLHRVLLLEKLPLLALSAAFCVAAVLGQQTSGAISSGQLLPLPTRLANALVSYVSYLWQLAWPANLGMYYPHPYLSDIGGVPPAAGVIALAAALLIALTTGALISRQRYLIVGWFWYLITLLPVIGLIQVGSQGMADRYTYVPSIGIFVAVAWGGAHLLAVFEAHMPRARTVGVAVAAALLVICSVAAWRQAAHWRDSLTLYEHTLAVTGPNPVIRFNYANELRRQGRDEEALREYRRALEVSPDDVKIHLNLANALRDASDDDGAERHYREVLARRPRHALAHSNLGSLLRAQGKLDEAEDHYRRSLSLSPRPVTVYNLANLLRVRGDLDEAIDLYERLVTTAPDARTHNNLGIALDTRGDLDAALQHFLAAVELDPSHHPAHNNAGSLLQRQGELEQAIAHYHRALEIEPNYATALVNLGTALRERKEFDAAIELYRKVLKVEPDDEDTRALLEETQAAQRASLNVRNREIRSR
jgi:tetratricopeptide (TPR) repeat protein